MTVFLEATSGYLFSLSPKVFQLDMLWLQVLNAIQVAEKVEKPPIKELFTDVYDFPPPNLCEQEASVREDIRRHPQDYPPDFRM